MVGFYADEGIEHVWPDDLKLGGGADASITDTSNCSRFGDCTEVDYEIMVNRELIAFVGFDGNNIALGKGAGTWECRTMGQTPFKGKFASEKNVEKILKDLAKKLPAFRKSATENTIQRLRVPSGWVIDLDANDAIETDFYIDRQVPSPDYQSDELSDNEKKYGSDYRAIAVLFSLMDVAAGDGRKGTYNLSLNDYGGYEQRTIFEDEGSYKSVEDIPKILKAFDSRIKKWRDKIGKEQQKYVDDVERARQQASVKGTTMKRSTAVALTRKAVRMIKAKHVAEIYPKVACQIMDESIVFVTTRSHLWAGVDASVAKAHIDEAAKAVTAAAESFLKAAKKAGDEGMTLVQNRKMGGGGLNSTKYPGLVQAYYVWSYPSGLDDALKGKAEEIAKSAKLEPNVKINW